MVTVNYSLLGANGDTIVFDNESFVLNPGMAGFGISPTSVRIDPSAGDGGVWRHTKRAVRNIDLPITVLGSDRNEVQEKLRRLARLTQDATGPTRLIASYSDGKQLFIEVHYTGGAESEWGQSEGMEWCQWMLSFKAPSPYWESTSTESFVVRTGNLGRGLLPELSKLKVTSSNSLGTVTVVSSADVPVFPLWTVTGPITDFTAISNGLSFSISGTIAAGISIFINTETGTVLDDSGANQYALLAPAPKLFPIQPGTTTIEVTGLDSTSETRIVCQYALAYEVIH
jgi:hypothetical protein